jgi:hypothetical protein
MQRGRPTDEPTLAAVSSIFHACFEAGSIVAVHEAAVGAAPDNEALMRLTCFAYLHVSDFKKLQAVRAAAALRLARGRNSQRSVAM